MINLSRSIRNLTKFEWILWGVSSLMITASFLLGENLQVVTLAASLVGVTALIFVAKGDAIGQILTVVFSVLYAVISFDLRYYGEMITYLGMTAPMAVLSAVSWLKHPYEAGKNEVHIVRLSIRQIIKMIVYSAAATILFYFVLRYFNNASLGISTISITTSFIASYLTFCRSSAYALGYAANDIVLIVLWILAAAENMSFLPMVICFCMFLANDLYGFYNWKRIQKKQSKKLSEKQAEQLLFD